MIEHIPSAKSSSLGDPFLYVTPTGMSYLYIKLYYIIQYYTILYQTILYSGLDIVFFPWSPIASSKATIRFFV